MLRKNGQGHAKGLGALRSRSARPTCHCRQLRGSPTRAVERKQLPVISGDWLCDCFRGPAGLRALLVLPSKPLSLCPTALSVCGASRPSSTQELLLMLWHVAQGAATPWNLGSQRPFPIALITLHCVYFSYSVSQQIWRPFLTRTVHFNDHLEIWRTQKWTTQKPLTHVRARGLLWGALESLSVADLWVSNTLLDFIISNSARFRTLFFFQCYWILLASSFF